MLGAGITDLDLETISLLAGLEELNLGVGIGLGLGGRKPAAAAGERNAGSPAGLRSPILGVAKLAKLKKLRELNLSGARVTAGGLKTLQTLPNFERLSLWHAEGSTTRRRPGWRRCRRIASLDLSNTGIGDQTLQQLAKLPNLKRLY